MFFPSRSLFFVAAREVLSLLPLRAQCAPTLQYILSLLFMASHNVFTEPKTCIDHILKPRSLTMMHHPPVSPLYNPPSFDYYNPIHSVFYDATQLNLAPKNPTSTKHHYTLTTQWLATLTLPASSRTAHHPCETTTSHPRLTNAASVWKTQSSLRYHGSSVCLQQRRHFG